ncbi:hypothetical protein R1sor_009099 [Riccia sorocarpa]|uniref:Endonuclease/exonuclease/phosphatase domain-containing protein n=1 Tax=Riccia sorocarpa TaxID=122646 RepID=A0ABD3H8C7_9MARC
MDIVGLKITVENSDKKNQFVCLRVLIGTSRTPSFIIFAYFAPCGAAVYDSIQGRENPFLMLTSKLLKLKEEGTIWLTGDFNARIGNFQGKEWGVVGDPVWRPSQEGEHWDRVLDDLERNERTNEFIQFITVSGLTVLNGVARFAGTQTVTCVTANGSSVVDFLLATENAKCRVMSLELSPLFPESDHKVLHFTLSGFSRSDNRIHKPSISLDKSQRQVYEQMVNSRLRTAPLEDLTSILVQSDRDVFTTTRNRKKSWFDSQCWEARCKAISGPADQQADAFRAYRNMIRARKRQFLRDLQVELTQELCKDPQSFWKRLRPKLVSADLEKTDMIKYVERLYYFPNLEPMLTMEGSVVLKLSMLLGSDLREKTDSHIRRIMFPVLRVGLPGSVSGLQRGGC